MGFKELIKRKYGAWKAERAEAGAAEARRRAEAKEVYKREYDIRRTEELVKRAKEKARQHAVGQTDWKTGWSRVGRNVLSIGAGMGRVGTGLAGQLAPPSMIYPKRKKGFKAIKAINPMKEMSNSFKNFRI